MKWEIVYAKQAMKDAKKLAASGLKPRAQELLALLANDPFQNPPPFEKLVGDLAGAAVRVAQLHLRRGVGHAGGAVHGGGAESAACPIPFGIMLR